MTNYCPDLFDNLYLEKVSTDQAELGFCCVSKRSDPVDEIRFDIPFLEEGRNFYIKTGKLPDACSQCITDEAAGSTSRRMQELHSFAVIQAQKTPLFPIQPLHYPTEINLKKLQYNCDNICNLKCIMCGSYYSSSWVEDEKALGMTPYEKFRFTKQNDKLFQFDASNINFIYFNGGEPLMTKDHIRVLTYLKESADSKNIHVCYNTNATFSLNNEIIDLWKNFANVTLVASIDAIGEAFEYVRFPAKWTEVSNNLQEYKNAVELNIGANIGVHNIMYFPDLYNFALSNNIKFNFQSDTQGFLSLKNTPKHLVPAIKEYLYRNAEPSHVKETLLKTLDLIETPDLRWIQHLYKLDKLRGNDWTKSLSNLFNLDPHYFTNYFDRIKEDDPAFFLKNFSAND